MYDIQGDGSTRCVAYNPRASLLAAGCSDGRVVIWDFLTRSIVKIFVGHVQPVTALRYDDHKFFVSFFLTFWPSSTHSDPCLHVKLV